MFLIFKDLETRVQFLKITLKFNKRCYTCNNILELLLKHHFHTFTTSNKILIFLEQNRVCWGFFGSPVIADLAILMPSCLSWVFRGSEIFSRKYFAGPNFSHGYFVSPKFFLVGILWVQNCSRQYFVGLKSREYFVGPTFLSRG